jgi:hypothetical protein
MAPLSKIETASQMPVHFSWVNNTGCFGPEMNHCLDISTHESRSCQHGLLAPLPKKISRVPKERRRRVAFTEFVEIKEVPSLSDIYEDDVINAWWTPNDYQLIRKMFRITLHMMMNGVQFENEDEDFCARGLEHRTKGGAQRHHRHKKRSIYAVLRAQEFQIQEAFNDADYLAEIYAENTRSSSKEAHSLALVDEQDARSTNQ